MQANRPMRMKILHNLGERVRDHKRVCGHRPEAMLERLQFGKNRTHWESLAPFLFCSPLKVRRITENPIVLIDRRTIADHLPWIVTVLVVTSVASVWFFVEAARASAWPSGSSLPGFTFGVLGGAIVLFELLLWWR